jgi:hypothetical protein
MMVVLAGTQRRRTALRGDRLLDQVDAGLRSRRLRQRRTEDECGGRHENTQHGFLRVVDLQTSLACVGPLKVRR